MNSLELPSVEFHDQALGGRKTEWDLRPAGERFIHRAASAGAARKPVIVKHHVAAWHQPRVDELDTVADALVYVNVDMRPRDAVDLEPGECVRDVAGMEIDGLVRREESLHRLNRGPSEVT